MQVSFNIGNNIYVFKYLVHITSKRIPNIRCTGALENAVFRKGLTTQNHCFTGYIHFKDKHFSD